MVWKDKYTSVGVTLEFAHVQNKHAGLVNKKQNIYS